MLRLRRYISWRLSARRSCACLFLLCYLATTIGLPLPAHARKEAGQPFPCQDNPCGCQSAEQCWTACCCYSVEEHWAWARAHDIEPPAYAVRPAEDGWNTRPQREREEGKQCVEGCASCCETPREAPQKEETRWVSGTALLHCHGLQMVGSSYAPSIPPPLPFAWSPQFEPAGLLTYPEPPAVAITTDPLVPPPRPPSM